MTDATTRRPTVAVIGDADLPAGDPREAAAEEAGRAIVDGGFTLVCGGRGGVMEAACRGGRSSARWSDGRIVGVLPGSDAADANPFVDIALPTGLGNARNVIIAHADAVLMIGGSAGTLSEAALATKLGRTVVALRAEGWSGKLADEPSLAVCAETVSEAIALIQRLVLGGA